LYSMIELCNQQLARLFGFLALSYIDVYADHPQEIATTRKTRTGMCLKYPVLLLSIQVAPLDSRRGALRHGFRHKSSDLGSIIRMHGGAPAEFANSAFFNPPKVPKHLVQVQAPTLRIADPDHNRGILSHQPEASFGLAKILRGNLPSKRQRQLPSDSVR